MYCIDTEGPHFKELLKSTLLSIIDEKKDPLFLCIGTDRYTGDALGPLIGKRLEEYGFTVLGTLSKPVHAVNIYNTIEEIDRLKKNKQIIAIDAGLGKNVGCVSVWKGSIQPGAGIHKNLPCVGDIGIMGIVAGYSANGASALHNVRLNRVINMAEMITSGILQAYKL